jgi:hypothetical protein
MQCTYQDFVSFDMTQLVLLNTTIRMDDYVQWTKLHTSLLLSQNMSPCNKESHEVPSEDNRSHVGKWNPGPLKCKAGVLIAIECH